MRVEALKEIIKKRNKRSKEVILGLKESGTKVIHIKDLDYILNKVRIHERNSLLAELQRNN